MRRVYGFMRRRDERRKEGDDGVETYFWVKVVPEGISIV